MRRKKAVKNFSKNIYTEYRAGRQLAGIAEQFWSFWYKPLITERKDITFLPTHQTSLVIITRDSKVTSAFFHGPTFKRKIIRTSLPIRIYAVNLAPFAALKYFRLGFIDLMNKSVSLSKAAGKQEYLYIKNNIEKCVNDKDAFKIFSEYLIKKINNAGNVDDDVEKLCRMIINSGADNKLEEFYSRCSCTKRQLQRKFKKIMAFTPKEFARLVRIQQSGTELVKSGFRHFDVLYKYGYYDQSHYIREFKQILGSSPKNFENSQKKIDFRYIND